MKYNSRITARKPFDDGRNEGSSEKSVAPDPHIPGRRVGKKLDVLHHPAKFIEGSHSAIEQRASVFSWLDPLPVAIEQAHAECMFEVRD